MTWLSGWAQQRVALEIDSSKIGSTLTNFPVMINLSDTSGIDSDDVTEVFDDLDSSVTGDTFTGTDGDDPREDFWTLGLEDPNGLEIQSNALYFNTDQTSGYIRSRLQSNFWLSGDFDIQIDFTLDTWTLPTVNNVYLPWFSVRNSSHTLIGRTSRTYTPSAFNMYMSSGDGYGTEYKGSADASGQLRLTRSSGTVKAFYWDNSQWEWDGSTAGRTVATSNTDDVYIDIRFVQQVTGDVEGYVDNFVINSGTVLWPQDTDPHRKKIAVTTSDGTTECKVEIEKWSHADQEATLWVKVPSVSSSETTTLYLYYDVNHAPNIDNVGDVGGYIDKFDSFDNDTINYALWNIITNTYENLSIQSNQLNFNSSESSDDTINISSKLTLSSDFDISIEIAPGTVATATSDQNLLSFGVRDTIDSWNVYGQVNYIKDSSGNYKFTITGSASETATVTESSMSTAIRIRRVGSTLTAWYWKSSAWEWNGDSNGEDFVLTSSVDMIPYLWAKSRASYASEVDYNNFVILSSGPATWDSNFLEVFHMAQDPSGGTNAIKDSCYHKNGTSSGAMTTSDLVDGPGSSRAIEFEGTNDYINIGAYDDFNVGTGDLTVEALFKHTLAQTGIITRTAIPGSNDAFGIYVNSSDEVTLHYRDSGLGSKLINAGVISTSAWHYVGSVRDTQVVKGRLDGASAGSDVSGANQSIVNHVSNRLGAQPVSATYYYGGFIAEIRYSKIARSADWQDASYYSLLDTLVTYSSISAFDPNKRLDITIDSSKVDSTLTDFPVLVNLSSSSGTGAFDATPVFDELEYAVPSDAYDDDFLGDDGDPPDVNKWINSGTEIQSNALYGTTPAGADKYARSIFNLDGDFDIQIDFDLSSAPATNNWYFFMDITNEGSGDPNSEDDQLMAGIRYAGGREYVCSKRDATVWDTASTVSTSDSSGQIRITRSSNTFKGYYWDSDWTQIGGDRTLALDSKTNVSLVWLSATGNPTLTSTFDNFVVNSGIDIEWRDNFAGDNGDAPMDWWSVTGSCEIQSNALRNVCDVTEGYNSQVTMNYFYIAGDFNIQVDFNQITGPATQSWSATLHLYDSTPNRVKCGLFYDGTSPSGRGYGIQGYSGSWDSITKTATSDTSGKIRLIRSSSTITGYYWNGSSWSSIGTRTTLGTNDAIVTLQVNCWVGNPDATFDFDNLVINSGTIEWYGEHPNRKKIRVTTSDLVTQCRVEIERWNDYEEEAALWVKVPSISSSEDTVISLFYDSSVNDNINYIGDIGDTTGEQVWDADFVAVYHFTSINTIDSTLNSNDGTVSGSPTIVDGEKSAEAVDLSGVSQYINMGSKSNLDDIVLLTVEAFFNADDYGEALSGRLVDKAVATNSGWSLLISSAYGALDFIRNSSGALGQWYAGSLTCDGTTWHYGAATHDRGLIGNDAILHLDGTIPSATEVAGGSGTWSNEAAANLLVGDRADDDRAFDGKIGEVRVSKIIRADAWIKATYYTLNDGLVAYGFYEGEEEEEEGVSLPSLVIGGSKRVVVAADMLIGEKWRTVTELSMIVGGKKRDIV